MTNCENGLCTLDIAGHEAKVLTQESFDKGSAARLVVRPEAALISAEGMIPCRVTLSVFMGAYQYYHVMIGDTVVKINDNCPINKQVFQEGEDAYISFSPDSVHLLAGK